MLGFLKMKVLFFGMLVSSPAIAVWVFRNSDSAPTQPQILPISNPTGADSIVRVPVEVIAAGSAPEVVYIEVASQALPKPAATPSSR